MNHESHGLLVACLSMGRRRHGATVRRRRARGEGKGGVDLICRVTAWARESPRRGRVQNQREIKAKQTEKKTKMSLQPNRKIKRNANKEFASGFVFYIYLLICLIFASEGRVL